MMNTSSNKSKFFQEIENRQKSFQKTIEDEINKVEDTCNIKFLSYEQEKFKRVENIKTFENKKKEAISLYDNIISLNSECMTKESELSSLTKEAEISELHLKQCNREYEHVISDREWVANIKDEYHNAMVDQSSKTTECYKTYLQWMNKYLGLDVNILDEETVEISFMYDKPEVRLSAQICVTDNVYQLLNTEPKLKNFTQVDSMLKETNDFSDCISNLRYALIAAHKIK